MGIRDQVGRLSHATRSSPTARAAAAKQQQHRCHLQVSRALRVPRGGERGVGDRRWRVGRARCRRPSEFRDDATTFDEVAFYAFDVLQINDVDTIALPYERRRELLADLTRAGLQLDGAAHIASAMVPRCLAATAEQGLEGVMAKRLGSPYIPGKRSPNWRKVKNRVQVEVVIGGFNKGTGNRSWHIRRAAGRQTRGRRNAGVRWRCRYRLHARHGWSR